MEHDHEKVGTEAHAIYRLAAEVQALTGALGDLRNFTRAATREDVGNMEDRLMSKIADLEATEQTNNAAVSAKLDELQTGITDLNRQITDFNNSPGTLSAEDQAAVDRMQAASKALADKAESVSLKPTADLPIQPKTLPPKSV